MPIYTAKSGVPDFALIMRTSETSDLRVEGDRDNAGYWYRQAKRPAAAGALDAEWDEIVAALLSLR
jgi:hypothetical protein